MIFVIFHLKLVTTIFVEIIFEYEHNCLSNNSKKQELTLQIKILICRSLEMNLVDLRR